MRPATLNPRLPVPQAATPAAASAPVTAPATEPGPQVRPGKRSGKGASTPDPHSARNRDEAGRPGGFHESSYELQSGLQISESDWPDDVTVPGALGSR